MSRAIVAVVIFISPFLWLARLAFLLVFAIPGMPIILMLAAGRVARVQFSRYFGRDVLLFPSAFFLWEFEDGVGLMNKKRRGLR